MESDTRVPVQVEEILGTSPAMIKLHPERLQATFRATYNKGQFASTLLCLGQKRTSVCDGRNVRFVPLISGH